MNKEVIILTASRNDEVPEKSFGEMVNYAVADLGYQIKQKFSEGFKLIGHPSQQISKNQFNQRTITIIQMMVKEDEA